MIQKISVKQRKIKTILTNSNNLKTLGKSSYSKKIEIISQNVPSCRTHLKSLSQQRNRKKIVKMIDNSFENYLKWLKIYKIYIINTLLYKKIQKVVDNYDLQLIELFHDLKLASFHQLPKIISFKVFNNQSKINFKFQKLFIQILKIIVKVKQILLRKRYQFISYKIFTIIDQVIMILQFIQLYLITTNYNIQKRDNMDINTIKQLNQFSKQIDAIRYKAVKSKVLKAQQQIERLLNQKFYNPYDVLLLDSNATDQEIRKQYKNFSLILHPDKCKDPKAKDAWQNVQQAHKTLCDPQKRKVYLRIMKEAKQRTQFQREKQNKKRLKSGQQLLSQSTFHEQYQQNCLKIFQDLEEKKEHLIKMQQSTFNKKMDDLQTKKMVQQFRILTQEEWERSREKRVSNWRDFTKKKFVVGSKKSDGSIRPPPVVAQSRPHYSVVEDKKKNL